MRGGKLISIWFLKDTLRQLRHTLPKLRGILVQSSDMGHLFMGSDSIEIQEGRSSQQKSQVGPPDGAFRKKCNNTAHVKQTLLHHK